MPASSILHADKGYDSDAIRRQVEDKGAMPNIPPKTNRGWKNCFSPFLYRNRNAIERMFGRLKDFRRIATRYDRAQEAFRAHRRSLEPWFEKQLSLISSGSTLATDIRYALSHWTGLTRFLEDGRLELDTNPVENAIRPVALTRKNALFAGHEVGAQNWALLASIVATCKLNDVDPVTYIANTLQAILDGHSQSRIDELMPWRFLSQSTRAA